MQRGESEGEEREEGGEGDDLHCEDGEEVALGGADACMVSQGNGSE